MDSDNKSPHYGPSTRMRKKNTIKKEFKRLKGIQKKLLIINGSEVPIHPTFERRQIVRGWNGRKR